MRGRAQHSRDLSRRPRCPCSTFRRCLPGSRRVPKERRPRGRGRRARAGRRGRTLSTRGTLSSIGRIGSSRVFSSSSGGGDYVRTVNLQTSEALGGILIKSHHLLDASSSLSRLCMAARLARIRSAHSMATSEHAQVLISDFHRGHGRSTSRHRSGASSSSLSIEKRERPTPYAHAVSDARRPARDRSEHRHALRLSISLLEGDGRNRRGQPCGQEKFTRGASTSVPQRSRRHLSEAHFATLQRTDNVSSSQTVPCPLHCDDRTLPSRFQLEVV